MLDFVYIMHVTYEDKNIFEEPKKYYNGKWKQTQLSASEQH